MTNGELLTGGAAIVIPELAISPASALSNSTCSDVSHESNSSESCDLV